MSEKHFVVILESEGKPGNVIGPFPTGKDAYIWGAIHGGFSAETWEVMSPEDYEINLARRLELYLKDQEL